MKIFIISPLQYAITLGTRYAGIEKLANQYATELSKQHQVTISCHADSILPSNVNVYPFKPLPNEVSDPQGELRAYQNYHRYLHTFDVIHDFSHQHFASRYNGNLPSLNIFWHDPIIRYPKAPYNIIALSSWAARRFKQFYHQDSKVMQSVIIDKEVYKPLPKSRRWERFLTIGRMAEEKGNLRAAMLCKEAGVILDICGADSDAKYKEQVERLCDGKQIRYLGEVSEEHKIRLMQTCRGLIYATSHAEVTNHKLQEAMFCGAPVIVSNIGAASEIVTHGVNGYLCNDKKDFLTAIEKCADWPIHDAYDKLVERYSMDTVIKDYEALYEQVKGGLRW